MRDHADGPPSDPDRWAVLLDRALAGDCTPAERLELDDLLAADPVLGAHVDTLRRGLQPPAAEVLGLDRSARAARLLTALGVSADTAAAPSRARLDHPQRTRPSRTWLRGVGGRVVGLRAMIPAVQARAARPLSAIAVAVVAALGVGLAVRSGANRHAHASHGREYATAAGQRLSVTLVDGTQLTLAPASRARVAAEYGQGSGSREVELEGEGYFTVVHDATHPFAVRLRGAVARDVGTAFDARAYPEDPWARIAVAEGKVVIAAPAVRAVRERPLQAGDVAMVVGDTITVAHGADVFALTGWRHGTLAFHDTPLPVVLEELSRWYGVDIRVGDARLGTLAVTATVGDEALDRTLDLLVPALAARYEHRGSVVTIYSARKTVP